MFGLRVVAVGARGQMPRTRSPTQQPRTCNPGAFEDGEVVVGREQEEREAEDHGPDHRGDEDDGAEVHRTNLTRQRGDKDKI